ncbi:carboxy-terminal protease [Pasteurella multocida subsp. multocida str. Anand1_cattle]|nr:carboxy-terminal protease [Pasteurella multocida subsp. multocida str. Anand1_cattle]
MSKTKSYLATFLLSTFLMSFNLVEAVQPKIKLSDIVTPQPTEENQLATKTCDNSFNTKSLSKFQLMTRFLRKFLSVILSH